MAENELPTTPNDGTPHSGTPQNGSPNGGESAPLLGAGLPANQAMPPDDTAPMELMAAHVTDEPDAEEHAHLASKSLDDAVPPSPPSSNQAEPEANGQASEEDLKETTSGASAAQVEEASDESPEADADAIPKDWYILKVQVNRENSIRDALQRRVKIEGLENYFGDIIVPTEDVAEFDKNGKKKIVKRKLYPGYLVAHMAITEETWFVVRETPGIGDFTGAAGKPSPMAAHEVQRILAVSRPDENATAAKTAIPFKVGDKVRVKEGYFQNFEGEVDSIDEANGRVTVMINIFGRSTPVELEHWQTEEV
jgi:transcriptional antiterminator NusG